MVLTVQAHVFDVSADTHRHDRHARRHLERAFLERQQFFTRLRVPSGEAQIEVSSFCRVWVVVSIDTRASVHCHDQSIHCPPARTAGRIAHPLQAFFADTHARCTTLPEHEQVVVGRWLAMITQLSGLSISGPTSARKRKIHIAGNAYSRAHRRLLSGSKGRHRPNSCAKHTG